MSSFGKFILVAMWVGVALALCFTGGFFGILGDKNTPVIADTHADITFRNYDGQAQTANFTPNTQVMCHEGVYDAERGLCVYQIPTVSYHLDEPSGEEVPQFNGTIDEFKVWNKTLNQDEIRNLYTQGFLYSNDGEEAKMNDGEWHHVAVLISNNTLVRYVDGKEVSTEQINQVNQGNFTVMAWVKPGSSTTTTDPRSNMYKPIDVVRQTTTTTEPRRRCMYWIGKMPMWRDC
jgi:hypothetical protein